MNNTKLDPVGSEMAGRFSAWEVQIVVVATTMQGSIIMEELIV